MWYSNNLLVDPTNPNIVYFSGTTNLKRSTNGGASWTAINSGADGRGPHVDYHGFAMDNTGRFLVVSDGGCYRYTVFDEFLGLAQRRSIRATAHPGR